MMRRITTNNPNAPQTATKTLATATAATSVSITRQNNDNTNNSSGSKATSISEDHLLACQYTLLAHRQVNLRPVSTHLFAQNLPSSPWLPQQQLPKQNDDFSFPCNCGEPHRPKPSPSSIDLGQDFQFALGKATTTQTSMHSSTTNGTDDPLLAPFSAASLKDLVETFQALLKLERQQILILYERYSQYNYHVRKDNTNDKLTSTNNHRQRDHIQPPSQSSRSIEIKGIADNARPALGVGDIILLRPMPLVSLPLIPRLPHLPLMWSSSSHSVQIHSKIRNVTKPDHVEITWLDPSNFDPAYLETSYPQQLYNLRFIPSTTDHERCVAALAWLSQLTSPQVAQPLLLPNEAPLVLPTPINTILKDGSNGISPLNRQQRDFVEMVVSRTVAPSVHQQRPPLVLTGPAGTGKTRTLFQCIRSILDMDDHPSKLLVCAPSHTAANVITQRLSQFLSSDQLFRLLDPTRPVNTIPTKVLQYCQQSDDTGDFEVPPLTTLVRYRVIVCTCSDAAILYEMGMTNTYLRRRRKCFEMLVQKGRAALGTTTITTSASSSLVPSQQQQRQEEVVWNKPHFTHLFIDEAAQATEPETMIPVSVVVDDDPSMEKVEIALVGDPRQLNPNTYSKAPNNTGLAQSWMERLLQRPVNYLVGGFPHMLGTDDSNTADDGPTNHQKLAVFLTLNYRSHPAFLMMPSAFFYFDKLKSIKTCTPNQWTAILSGVRESLGAQHVQCSPPAGEKNLRVISTCWNGSTDNQLSRQPSDWPIHFHGVVGTDVSESIETFAGSSSWANHQEAEMVRQIVVQLVRGQKVSTRSIGVMAPFRGQVVLIRKLLREVGLSGIDVGTIEDYQAVERDVIILSLTRSNPKFMAADIDNQVGVFSQIKTTNVALTRAEQLLFVVGNPHVMVKDDIWKQWLWFCWRNCLWFGEGVDDNEMLSGRIRVESYRNNDSSSLFPSPSSSSSSSSSKENDDVVIVSSLERQYRRR